MTYSVGGLVQASDFNTFATNLNTIWSTGATDSGWGQTALSTVAGASPGPAGRVTATNWASLVNILATAGSQTNTAVTARTAPVTGNLIAILNNVATDITNCTTNRGNATVIGATSSTWTGSTAKTTATGDGTSAWTITFTHVITFPSANAARYFWNAGGLVRLDMSKTSTGTDIDAEWNTFVSAVGTWYMSGRVNNNTQTITSGNYTGFTRSGGSGIPSPNLTTTGWYTLTAGAAATTMMTLTNSASPYTGETITITAAKNAGATTLTFVTTWTQPAVGGAGQTNNITGGTDTASPYTAFGTAPAVLCRYIPPSTTYLTTAAWGTPTIAASVA